MNACSEASRAEPANERQMRRASGPVTASGFLVALDHSAVAVAVAMAAVAVSGLKGRLMIRRKKRSHKREA